MMNDVGGNSRAVCCAELERNGINGSEICVINEQLATLRHPGNATYYGLQLLKYSQTGLSMHMIATSGLSTWKWTKPI